MEESIKIEIAGKAAEFLTKINPKQRDFLLSHYMNKKIGDFKKFIQSEHGIVVDEMNNQGNKNA